MGTLEVTLPAHEEAVDSITVTGDVTVASDDLGVAPVVASTRPSGGGGGTSGGGGT